MTKLLELADAYAKESSYPDWLSDQVEINKSRAALVAEIERVERDAARYRWIAKKVSAHGICDGWQFGFPTALTLPANALSMRDPESALGQCIDTAIDAAIAAAEGSKT